MSRNRLLAAIAIVLAVAGLMIWQHRRNALVAACVEQAGIWDGTICRADPRRIIIQRDLHRG